MKFIVFIFKEEKIMKNKTFYITTPIYYPSGNLHIGNTYTTVVCDAIARYKKEMGYDVYYLTGTDEHGQKIQNKAMENNLTCQEYVDKMADGIQDLWKKLKICNNDFIRTTQLRHEKVVQEVFTKFLNNGDIYLGKYQGWYCKECESFFTKTQLVDGKCPDCGREVVQEEEEAYFFKMSKYADRLLKYYEDNPNLIKPESRKTEIINNFIKPGLNDLCVSRTSFDWGIKVKENPKHVVYVWIDALFNYISALGYLSDDDTLFKKYWLNGQEKVHVMAKEIIRFHLIYWPIMLMALDLPLPDHFYAHGWIVMKEGKMSKSKGNVVYPLPLVENYGLDSLRYYLLREIPIFQDGIFTPEQFVERLNTDLANDYGNLAHRSVSMINKYFNGVIPEYHSNVTEFDEELEALQEYTIKTYIKKMDEFEITSAIETIFALISKANKYIEDCKPWALAKDENSLDKLKSVMSHLANVIYVCSVLLRPILIEIAPKILKTLNVSDELATFEKVLNNTKIENIKVEEKPTPAFLRLDATKEVEKIKNIINGKGE